MRFQKIKIKYILLFSIIILDLNAQENIQSAFTFNYNYQVPTENAKNIFGKNSAVGFSYFLELEKNIIFGIETNYLFGSDINDSTIFENISTSSGGIIGADGHYANINLMQRGFDSYLFTGYAIHQSKNNLSGIYILQGFGYIEKKIFIDTKNQNVPQLDENMKKGYDQFSNGFSTKTSIDYKYYHDKGRFQMSIGINYTMGYIKNLREYDFANNQYYSSKRRWSKLLGLKTEIIIPINRKNENEFHYY